MGQDDVLMSGSDSDDDEPKPFKIKTGAIEISGEPSVEGSTRPSWFLRRSQVKAVDGKLFVRMEGHKSNIRRLLCCHANVSPKHLHKVMRQTDVLHQMEAVRNEARRTRINSGKSSNAKEWRGRNKHQIKAKLTMGNFIEIDTPDISGVKGIKLNVLATPPKGKGAGLFMELTSENLLYVAQATAAQWAAGGVERQSRKRKNKQEGDNEVGGQHEREGDQTGH